MPGARTCYISVLMRSPAAPLAALAIAILSCSRADSADGPQKDEPVATVTAEGLRATLRASQAKATLVNAWATWCDSCEHELPMLQRLSDTFASRGVRVVLVSVDEPNERAQVQKFLDEHAIRMKSYLAARPLGAFKTGINPRWPGMLPASFLFDSTGKLRYFWPGEAFENEVVPIVEGLLAGKPIDGEADFGVREGATAPRE